MNHAPRVLGALSLALAVSEVPGCANHHYQVAEQEQRASDDLRKVGATEASRAAQDRADAHRQSAKCKDAVECVFEVLGQVLGGMLLAEKPGK